MNLVPQQSLLPGSGNGSVMLRYDDPSLLPAVASNGARALVQNSWVPGGLTEFVYDSVSGWVPVPGTLLAKLDGTAGSPWLLDLTASALTPGVWTEVYTSPILPDWMFPDGATLMALSEYGVSDSSSTATINSAAGFSSAAYGSVSAPFSTNYAGNVGGRTGGATLVRIRRNGSNLKGSQAVSAVSGGLSDANIGVFSDGAMRFRLSVATGATTNVIRLASFALFAGYP